MHARIWTGWTRREQADAYAAFLDARAVPDYAGTPGNIAVHILRRDEGDRSEFTTVTLWESLEAIRAFAGDDISQAVFYPEDDGFLVERGPVVRHYEVTSSAVRTDSGATP